MTAPRPIPVLAVLCGLALLVLLGIANAAGYRYGVSDQAFYVPAILHVLDPSLYPKDAALLQAQGRLMVSDELTAWLVQASGVRLESLMLAGHVISLGLLFAAAWRLGRRVSASIWTGVACALAVTLRHRITETGANSFEGYYHPRGLAFAAGAWAAVAFSTAHPRLAWACVAASLVLHPTTGLWWAVWLAAATVIVRPDWRRISIVGTIVVLVVAAASITMSSLAARLQVMDDAWIRPFASKDYVFPTDWALGPWIANLVLPVVVVAVWRWRAARELAERWEGGAVAGVLALVCLFLASLPFIAAHIALAVQLQTSRIFWVVDLFAVIWLVWAIAEGGARVPRLRAQDSGLREHAANARRPTTPTASRRPMVVAGVLLAVSLGRGAYITQVEHPERPFVQRDLENDDWVRVGRWLATQTSPDTHVLADPDHDWKFGHSVRLTARRDVLVEGVKDAAISLYDRGVALRTQERLAAIGDFATLDAAKARALDQKFALDVLVIDRDLPLPEMHREGRFRVYALK